MTHKSNVIFRTHTEADREGIIDFLYSLKDELYFAERAVAEEITSLLFIHGGAIVGTVEDEIVVVGGYFLGEPAQNFANKEVGFIYVAGIAKPYRGTAVFRTGLQYLLKTFQMWGLKEIRMHALESDKRLNALYGSFANVIRKETNRRGLSCVLYGNTLDGVMQVLAERERRRHMYNITPMHRPAASHPHGT